MGGEREVALSPTPSTSPAPQTRICTVCTGEIPASRLRALPNASQCVSCVEASGDVVRIKRLDEYIGKEGEDIVETYYLGSNPYISAVQMRVPGSVAGVFYSQLNHEEVHV